VSAQEGRTSVSSRRAALVVPCHVSDRWFNFRDREQYEVIDEDLIHIDVMTRDDAGRPYKLCELIVSRGDLLRAIAAYGDPSFRTRPVRRTAVVHTDPGKTARTRQRPRKKKPQA
jgi:hypothetical protein